MICKDCIDNEILNTVGKSHGEDTLWWLLILRKGYTAYALQKSLAYYRMVEGSLSSKVLNNQLTVWHSYRNELGLDLIKASLNYLAYLIDVSLRRFQAFIQNLMKNEKM